MYKFVPATVEHVKAVIRDMRDEDAMEIDALTGNKMEQSILETVDRSDEAWACLVEGDVVAIFGVGSYSIMSDKGCPWLVTTKKIEKHKKALIKATPIAINHWLQKYSSLENYVDASYSRAIRWLKWAGFTVEPPEPFGAYGRPFHRVVRQR